MKILLIGLLALALAGCATTHVATASGSPEVTVAAVSGPAVKAFITAEMLNRGYRPHSSSDETIEFDKLAPVGAQALLGSALGPLTMRTSFVIVPLGSTVRVVASPAMVSWAGTAQERPAAGIYTAPQVAVDDVNAVLASVRQHFHAA
jgi:hypothetical protein